MKHLLFHAARSLYRRWNLNETKILRALYDMAQNRAHGFPACYDFALPGETRKVTLYVPDASHYTRFLKLCDRLGAPQAVKWPCKKPLELTGPVFIPVSIAMLEDLPFCERFAPPGVLALLARPNMHLLLDLSNEAIHYGSGMDNLMLGLHAGLARMGAPPGRVWFLNANLNNQTYDAWWERHRPAIRLNVLSYHFYLYLTLLSVRDGPWFRRREPALIAAARRALTGHNRPFHYLTLNLKPREHRMALLLYLIDRGFLDKGIVTYFGEGGQKADPGPLPASVNALLAHTPMRDARAAWQALERIRPLTYERQPGDMARIWLQSDRPDFLIPELARHRGIRIDSYVEIVTETYFGAGENLYITEKLIRPIVRFQPFIHIGEPFALRELRARGFKTFAPFIDESYDAITDPAARMAACLGEVAKICAMDRHALHAAYCALWPIYEHNFRHAVENAPQLFGDDAVYQILLPLRRAWG